MQTRLFDVSIVTTVLNEASSLPKFLSSINNQTLTPAELVIVDGGSSDGTVDLIRQWAARSTVPVTLIQEPGANISRGRNVAIQAAKYEYVAVTDAGTTLSSAWLESLGHKLSKTQQVVAGFFEPAGDGYFSRLVADITIPRLAEIVESDFLPSSRSIAFTKFAWRRVGGYPEWLDYCEDLVFDLQLRNAGFSFAFAPAAIVFWAGRDNLWRFAKQYFRYARGDARASLWPKRHAARYTAYTLLFTAQATRRPKVIVAAYTFFYWMHMHKFISRSNARRVGRTRRRRVVDWLCGVGILLTGDIAKMSGYIVGSVSSLDRMAASPGVCQVAKTNSAKQ